MIDIRQARTGNTVLVMSRKMTGRTQTLPWWLGGRRGKDDRNIGPVGPDHRERIYKYRGGNPGFIYWRSTNSTRVSDL
jgi:hypothetical protein